ncbi:MAG: hypothetical protein GY861_23515 [bacterium]|nr:hypothetical protein [bacterium]
MKVRVCPQCRSINIKFSITSRGIQVFQCMDCEYSGESIVEEEIEKKF